MFNFCQRLLFLSSALFLQACQDSEEAYEERPVEQLYSEALSRLNSGSYSKAAVAFAEVERQHPYSNWAVRAQLMSGFAYYQAKKYDEAIENFSVFIGLHPMHKDVAYAQYMIGICYYEQVPITARDQQSTTKALNAFQEVITRYPDSSYAKDARIKLDFIQDHLAGKEMEIGRFYQKQTNHLAAINRFKVVVEHYQTTSHAPEALHRLVESYLSLGLMDQAKASAAVLGHNYPGSTWYQESYALFHGKGMSMPVSSGVTLQKSENSLPESPDINKASTLPPSTQEDAALSGAKNRSIEEKVAHGKKISSHKIISDAAKNATQSAPGAIKKEESGPVIIHDAPMKETSIDNEIAKAVALDEDTATKQANDDVSKN